MSHSCLPYLYNDDANMVRCSFAIHEDEFRPVLLMQGYENGVNDVADVVLDCHNAIHFVEISSEAS